MSYGVGVSGQGSCVLGGVSRTFWLSRSEGCGGSCDASGAASSWSFSELTSALLSEGPSS